MNKKLDTGNIELVLAYQKSEDKDIKDFYSTKLYENLKNARLALLNKFTFSDRQDIESEINMAFYIAIKSFNIDKLDTNNANFIGYFYYIAKRQLHKLNIYQNTKKQIPTNSKISYDNLLEQGFDSSSKKYDSTFSQIEIKQDIISLMKKCHYTKEEMYIIDCLSNGYKTKTELYRQFKRGYIRGSSETNIKKKFSKLYKYLKEVK
jgi:hypothetical protein